MRGDDNRLFERIRQRSFNERMIYQLGNRREEDIKTILKDVIPIFFFMHHFIHNKYVL